jgi:hypothetical protein
MKSAKTILLAALATLILVPSLNAQKNRATPAADIVYRNEIFVGYGAPGNSDILIPLLKMYGTAMTLGGYNEKNMKATGAFSVGYKYRFDKVASLGATYSVGVNTGDVYWSSDYWGKFRGTHHTIAVECDFRYITRKIVNLYSTVGLAATFSCHKYTSADPNDQRLDPFNFILPDFHVSLIGVKVGGYRFGGFAELGLGYKGIVHFGAYVRF